MKIFMPVMKKTKALILLLFIFIFLFLSDAMGSRRQLTDDSGKAIKDKI